MQEKKFIDVQRLYENIIRNLGVSRLQNIQNIADAFG